MKPKKLKCPYCRNSAVLQKASFVYGEKAIEDHVYVCINYPSCDSYVGVHQGTMKPKGTLADGNLRNKRIQAHKKFSKLWTSRIITKKQAYKWMQFKFGLNANQAHIGLFSNYMCDQLMAECETVLKNNSKAS